VGGRSTVGTVCALVTGASVLLAACGTDEPAPDAVEPAAAYTAIVDWQAAEQEPTVDADGQPVLPVIYIAAADGETIAVGDQAAVAEATTDIATVRFADRTADAFEGDTDDAPVRDHGSVLVVGPMPDADATITVDVVRYRNADDAQSFEMEIGVDSERADTTRSATVMSATPT
jgi:hypothetical protein